MLTINRILYAHLIWVSFICGDFEIIIEKFKVLRKIKPKNHLKSLFFKSPEECIRKSIPCLKKDNLLNVL